MELEEELMSATAPLLSVVVPMYDSQGCLDWAFMALVDYNDEVEVLITNDGSKGDTARMTDEWALRYPGMVRAIHQENKGHDGAVSTGTRAANSTHVCMCDSDNWVGRPTMSRLFDLLCGERAVGRDLDLIITNHVYEKQGRTHETAVRYRNVFPQGKAITREEVKPCRYDQYMMAHSLTMYTEILCRFGLTLSEYTFHIDYLYSHIPLPLVCTTRYLNIDLHRYFIGHDDQSMNEKVMISCLDQLLCVNREVVIAMSKPEEMPANPYRYTIHYLRIDRVVMTVMAQLSGTSEYLEMKDKMWNELEATDPAAGAAVESDSLARLVRSRSRRFVMAAYLLVRVVVGFSWRLTSLGFRFAITIGYTLRELSWRIGKTQGRSGSSGRPRQDRTTHPHERTLRADLTVVGLGFFGLTIVCQAVEAGHAVTALERRGHIGGNARSSIDSETGIRVRRYGTHLFHTSNERVWAYTNRFTPLNSYQHHVCANHGGVVHPLPINLGTINQFFASTYTPGEACAPIVEQAAELGDTESANLEEKTVSLIGRPFCETFAKGYMYKQWQTNPEGLNALIISRLPVRFTYDNRYSRDTHERLPLDGCAAWLERLANHENVGALTDRDFFGETYPYPKPKVVDQTGVIYIGALDRYFNYKLGSLTRRTLNFESGVVDTPDFQGYLVMDYSDESVSFTRIHELTRLHPERGRTGMKNTLIMRKFSRFAQAENESYYPVGRPVDREIFAAYCDLVVGEGKVVSGGRLGSYEYLDMRMAIGSALNRFDGIVSTW